MKKITHPIYKDYEVKPYISPDRDLEAWANHPERFPYNVIEKKQMERLPEGVLPGDIIMLWRINFGNFTNESIFPQYFEYKYGIKGEDSIETLIDLGFVERCTAIESLPVLSASYLKDIMKENGLVLSGKKAELLERIVNNVSEEKLAKQFTLRNYKSTESGKELLKKYDAIIQKHGPKM